MTASNFITNISLTTSKQLEFESSYLGLMDYMKALNVQMDLGNLARDRNQISVVGLQHPAVITLGHRADEMTEILMSQNTRNIPIVRSTRGGLATIHSEGQLVIYPIMNLRFLKLGVRDYVFLLLTTTQNLLEKYKIHSRIDLNGAGLYTEKGKIAFCGIHIREGITTHGVSLNIRNDLSLFQMIRSCGIQNLKMDSMSEYQVSATLEEIYYQWSDCFRKNFQPIAE
ncbi:MAG: lipoyl(octanoyl) transferase [Bdellovibrionales bacterium RIFCSPHIGHO2_01_FULL_40_29]|nr:MAG: lipoyl(octanoyl) transferase [Bdellovibrionales bacterium RIFCSPHIGHO2_01_FULL_40_29]OFZ32967.1 MAG: lipoyl(octanoyl) transferase [Bdellovibrionales bacterium RIFCSPHIGHO2_02_FULL_40_15]